VKQKYRRKETETEMKKKKVDLTGKKGLLWDPGQQMAEGLDKGVGKSKSQGKWSEKKKGHFRSRSPGHKWITELPPRGVQEGGAVGARGSRQKETWERGETSHTSEGWGERGRPGDKL